MKFSSCHCLQSPPNNTRFVDPKWRTTSLRLAYRHVSVAGNCPFYWHHSALAESSTAVFPSFLPFLTDTVLCSVDLTKVFADNKSIWISAGSTIHNRCSSQSPSTCVHINDSLWGGNFYCLVANLQTCILCLYPTSRNISTFRQFIICCPIFKLMPWAIIKSKPMITSSTISATRNIFRGRYQTLQ